MDVYFFCFFFFLSRFTRGLTYLFLIALGVWDKSIAVFLMNSLVYTPVIRTYYSPWTPGGGLVSCGNGWKFDPFFDPFSKPPLLVPGIFSLQFLTFSLIFCRSNTGVGVLIFRI
jgi:hypothetical protein